MKRRKLTKAREQVGDLMLQTLIVEGHCKKLYGGEHWPHEQFLFVWELVRNWDEDRYRAAALDVVDDLQDRGIYIEKFSDQQNGDV